MAPETMPALGLADLNVPGVGQFMAEEIDLDMSLGRLYLSDRLSTAGQAAYPDLLREAALRHDAEWLAASLSADGLWSATEQRRNPRGGFSLVRAPRTAALTLADGKYNRLYLRGLCRLAQERGVAELTVYRAKAVPQPRPESERVIGSPLDAAQVLAGLRAHPSIGLRTAPPAG